MDSAMSQNLYTYVGNNPINYIDPTGHDWEKIRKTFEEIFAFQGECAIANAEMARLQGEAMVNFFKNDTYTTTNTNTYADGYFYSTDTLTAGFSEWNYRFNGKHNINSATGLGLVGVFGKIGVAQSKQRDGIDFYGEGGAGDITLSSNNVLDALVLKGQAGVGANNNSVGLLVEAKAAVLSDRQTVKLSIFDWEVEAGLTIDVLSAGL